MMRLLLAPALTSSLCAPLHQMLDQLAVQPSFWLASFICAPLAALLLDFSIDQFTVDTMLVSRTRCYKYEMLIPCQPGKQHVFKSREKEIHQAWNFDAASGFKRSVRDYFIIRVFGISHQLHIFGVGRFYQKFTWPSDVMLMQLFEHYAAFVGIGPDLH